MGKQKPERMPAGYFGWALLDGEHGKNMLVSLLHNMRSDENGDRHEYCRGVLVSVVTMLQVCGMNFDDAKQLVWQCLPTNCHYQRFPPGWHQFFLDRMDKSTIPADLDKVPHGC